MASEALSVTPWSDKIQRHLEEKISSASSRITLMKIGALLHDIAKPQTKTVTDVGRTRFIGHTKQGAAVAGSILERLRFSKREVTLIENLVYHHLRPVQMSNEGFPSGRAVYRYFRDTKDAGIDILFFALADYLAMCGPALNMEQWKQHNALISYIINEHERQKSQVFPVALVTGNDLIREFNLSPGPLIGKLLAHVLESHVAGEIRTREEAISLVRKDLETDSQ